MNELEEKLLEDIKSEFPSAINDEHSACGERDAGNGEQKGADDVKAEAGECRVVETDQYPSDVADHTEGDQVCIEDHNGIAPVQIVLIEPHMH